MEEADELFRPTSGMHRTIRFATFVVGYGPYRGAYAIEEEAEPRTADGVFAYRTEARIAADNAARAEIDRRFAGAW
jgi:hypothetical protein